MFEITKRILKNELIYKGNILLTYRIEYPQIVSNTYDSCKFNTSNYQKAIALEQYAKETLFLEAQKQYDYNVVQGYPIMIYEVISNYYITCNQAPILSLYQDEYIYSGGAHGSTVRTPQNWNLCCNSQFSLNDIHTEPNYILCILRQIHKQIEEQGCEFYFDNYCSLVLETFCTNQFYLTPTAIVIYFQQYDIAPYSTGIPTFEITSC